MAASRGCMGLFWCIVRAGWPYSAGSIAIGVVGGEVEALPGASAAGVSGSWVEVVDAWALVLPDWHRGGGASVGGGVVVVCAPAVVECRPWIVSSCSEGWWKGGRSKEPAEERGRESEVAMSSRGECTGVDALSDFGNSWIQLLTLSSESGSLATCRLAANSVEPWIPMPSKSLSLRVSASSESLSSESMSSVCACKWKGGTGCVSGSGVVDSASGMPLSSSAFIRSLSESERGGCGGRLCSRSLRS